ncbi:hypothetical protein EYF80_023434 [Liparis tanakae]|uniref:Uncharacterized protein n=1 Tax=Liparis tanakae TaxID=230148 RepID=A0A4Z2HM94_9TELE|nr:hypothetical protein EYF80_023434 [Liparis tanakae]
MVKELYTGHLVRAGDRWPVKGLCLLWVNGGLPALLDLDVLLSVGVDMLDDFKLHHFGGWHDTDRHVPQARRVVAEVNLTVPREEYERPQTINKHKFRVRC